MSFEMTVKSDTDYGGLIEYPLDKNTTLLIECETDYGYVAVEETRTVNLNNVCDILLKSLKKVQQYQKNIITD